tara:strand:+ start:19 stop:501 length:483 start_codon:yes stop_codon:yes gene_type:complete
MDCIDIFGYDGKYEIDTEGNIFSNARGTRKKLKTKHNKDGYLVLNLIYNNKPEHFLIHRLVAYHFIENNDVDNKILVHHKNQKRDDNRVENLEWIDHLTNCQTWNQGNYKSNTSGFKNISYSKWNDNWIFRIRVNGKYHAKSSKFLKDVIEYKKEYLKSI